MNIESCKLNIKWQSINLHFNTIKESYAVVWIEGLCDVVKTKTGGKIWVIKSSMPLSSIQLEDVHKEYKLFQLFILPAFEAFLPLHQCY